MRPGPTRSLAAAAALLAAAVAAGCSDERPDPSAGTPARETASSSSRVVAPPPAASSSSARPTATPPSTPATPATPPPTPTPTAARVPLISSATWADSDYGVTLKVAPTRAGRGAGGALDSAAAWQEVLRLAPDAGTPGMWEQFDCHWTWARILEPDKPTWNLEPWRPVVADEQMLAEGCNPGGPEV